MKRNEPAFPVEIDASGNGIQTGECSGFSKGLTKREYFAGQMLAARLTGLSMQKQDYMLSQVVLLSINDADELLKQLES